MKERIEKMSVSPEGTLRQALQAIDRGGLGMALLLEPGSRKFAGLVTDGDIRRALLAGQGLDSPIRAVARPESRVAYSHMSNEELAAFFNEDVRSLPILDEQGRVEDIAVFDRRVHLPVAEPSLNERELEYVSECVLTGWISSTGKFVLQFEKMFAEFCGTAHAVSASNGTTALHLALLAYGIGPGDEVIVPTLTFIASANTVRYTGATPIFVDSDPLTWNLDPEAVERAITPRTRAIMPVHLYGHPADMDAIMGIAKKNNLRVIEDAAEAHGARYKGRRVGSIGDVSAFSFYGNKIITTGEGGMLTTNDADIAAKMRRLRDHGMDPKRRYWHDVLGYNYRLTNLQAAIGVAQMEKVEALLDSKRRIAATYRAGLKDIPGLAMPPEAPWAQNVFWLFSLIVDPKEFGMDRNELMKRLQASGIDSRPLFPCVHQQPIYATGGNFPVAERLSAQGISLPSAAGMHMRDVERVVEAIRQIAATGEVTAPHMAAIRLGRVGA